MTFSKMAHCTKRGTSHRSHEHLQLLSEQFFIYCVYTMATIYHLSVVYVTMISQ
jgi:hypothetical protein